MSLKFKCSSCGQFIVCEHLKIGEIAECKSCGAKNVIPKSAIETDERPVYKSSNSSPVESTQKSTEDLADKFGFKTRIKGIHILTGVLIIVVLYAISNYIKHPNEIKYLNPGVSVPSSTTITGIEKEIDTKKLLQIVSINSYWDWTGELLCPHLNITFKNVSDRAINELVVKATIIDTLTNQIFGDASAYVIGYGDAPLRPGYSKTAYLVSSVGYKNDIVALNFPNLVSEVYVNDKLYEKVPISKQYAGVEWGKK